MSTPDLNYLYDNRSDSDVRMVLEDWQRQEGANPTRLGPALWLSNAYADSYANAYAYADADSYAYAYVYADADDNADDNAYANTYANAYTNAYADADASYACANDADVSADAQTHKLLIEELDMRDGLVILRTPGYYGGPTRVGWLRRVGGDNYVLLPGFRSVSRTSGNRELPELAGEGPGRDHKLGKPSPVEEDVQGILVWRCLRADEAAWAATIPKPADWP